MIGLWPFLQDGVKLAQALVAAGGTTASAAEIAAALRGYERERTARSAPVIVKSWIMGAQLRIRGGPVSHPLLTNVASTAV